MMRSPEFVASSIKSARSLALGALFGLFAGFCPMGAAGAQADSSLGSIRGLVHDSLLARAPLADAVVEILQLGRTETTDGRGVFRFDGVPAGRYLVSFTHPDLASLGVNPPERTVAIGSGIDVTIVLTTPSATTIYRGLCGANQEANTGLVVGQLTEATTGAPIDSTEIRGEWEETVLSPGTGPVQRSRAVSAVTGNGGFYRLCGVPNDVAVLLTARRTDVVGAPLELRLDGKVIGKRDVRLALKRTAVTRVAGTVRDEEGRPVPGALVTILGGERGTRTTDAGRFTIDSLLPGSHAVDVRAVGYLRGRTAVELRADVAATADVTLARAPALSQSLPELVVEADKSASDRTGFSSRRERALGGYFIGRDDIRRRNTIRTQDLFHTVPGMRVQPVGGTEYALLSARGGVGLSTTCSPTLYVDGIPIPPDENGTSIPLDPQEIHGIEVYHNPAVAPIEFQRSGAACAIILAWSRRGERR